MCCREANSLPCAPGRGQGRCRCVAADHPTEHPATGWLSLFSPIHYIPYYTINTIYIHYIITAIFSCIPTFEYRAKRIEIPNIFFLEKTKKIWLVIFSPRGSSIFRRNVSMQWKRYKRVFSLSFSDYRNTVHSHCNTACETNDCDPFTNNECEPMAITMRKVNLGKL